MTAVSTPESAATVLKRCTNIVVKIGSSLLVGEAGLREEWLRSIAVDISTWVARGDRVTIVSSGAVALGRPDHHRPLEMPDKQASAAVGQVYLSQAWQTAFASLGLTVGQVLLTPADTEHRRRHLNARATLAALHTRQCIAVINENDTVATDELRYGDNDQLASRVAQMIDADCLLLLSDVPGLMTAPPSAASDGQLVAWLDSIEDSTLALAGPSGSEVGTGGMRSKLVAAQRATRAGAMVIIADGEPDHPLAALEAGGEATVCASAMQPGRARRRWIAGMVGRDATVHIDAGAVHALRNGKSLLAVGVEFFSEPFDVGDCLSIQDSSQHEIAVGLAGWSSADLEAHADSGRSVKRRPLVHRDDLIVFDGGAT
ncbi:MAG: glutamate 5-kinase [Pseudomonadota bacterium]